VSTVYEQAFPEIPWREPIRVSLAGSEIVRYGCRLCIAEFGLKGSEVKGLWDEPAQVLKHIETHH
jgi:hypothetical protein